MIQIYIFNEEGSAMDACSSRAMKRVNHFLAQDVETNLIDVTSIHQSESQSVSVWEGTNDWSYSFTITLVMNVHPSDMEKIHLMYMSS